MGLFYILCCVATNPEGIMCFTSLTLKITSHLPFLYPSKTLNLSRFTENYFSKSENPQCFILFSVHRKHKKDIEGDIKATNN